MLPSVVMPVPHDSNAATGRAGLGRFPVVRQHAIGPTAFGKFEPYWDGSGWTTACRCQEGRRVTSSTGDRERGAAPTVRKEDNPGAESPKP